MENFVAEVRAAVSGDAFILALMGALALVDICAALDSEDGRTSGVKFRKWFAENRGGTRLSPADAYQLRCGMLHQGRAAAKDYDTVIFALPSEVFAHENIVGDQLQLDLRTFVEETLAAVESWWERNQEVEPVRTNSRSLLRPQSLTFPTVNIQVPVLA